MSDMYCFLTYVRIILPAKTEYARSYKSAIISQPTYNDHTLKSVSSLCNRRPLQNKCTSALQSMAVHVHRNYYIVSLRDHARKKVFLTRQRYGAHVAENPASAQASMTEIIISNNRRSDFEHPNTQALLQGAGPLANKTECIKVKSVRKIVIYDLTQAFRLTSQVCKLNV